MTIIWDVSWGNQLLSDFMGYEMIRQQFQTWVWMKLAHNKNNAMLGGRE
jgi:hypothetical protein